MKKTSVTGVLCIALFSLTACSPDTSANMLPANIWGFNHIKGTYVNWYTVNGAQGRGAVGVCCVMVPEKWTPNQTVVVEWEVDPNSRPGDMPGVTDPAFKAYMV
ncbi:DUF3304 domain-containing protein, partial [Providencia rettgeri]|nr:DUF3304 domain-containing protein [Providencia rettgeri]ELY3856952.1 DUF3304 domain-containing protein [Providencia rettgeri]